MTDPLRPLDTDAEPDDRLAPARGCLLGMVVSLALWTLLILLVVAAWKVTR